MRKPMRLVSVSTALLTALLATSALLPVTARADQIADLFKEFDADHDGGITLAEFAEHRALRFQKYDANADQAISLEEFTAGLAVNKLEGRKQRFAEMDTNRDGLLTEADMADRARGQFGEMDKSGDGRVDLAEFTAAVHPVQNAN
jgi:Ca2+-binding EF-hand superfamily protein